MSVRDLVVLLIVVICMIYGLVLITPVWAEHAKLEEDLAVLLQQKAAKEESLRQKTKEIDRLSRHDPVAVEKVLRERFAYCKPTEKIIQLQRQER